MAAQIRWDPGDTAGERTLPCIVPATGRFNRWKMLPKIQGERAEEVGSGVGHVFEVRRDSAASMEFLIANADSALLWEFAEWADGFNVFSIDTGDSESNTYEECQIKVGTEIDISPPDPETLDLTLSMTVLNIAVAPAPMRTAYQ